MIPMILIGNATFHRNQNSMISHTFSISGSFHSFEVRDARVLIEVIPTLARGQLELEILGDPSISGSISTDIDWVPDDLILSFAEDAIFEAIEDAVDEEVPRMVSDLVDAASYAGQVGDIAFEVEVSEIDSSHTALAFGMDVDAEWLGDACEVPDNAGDPQGRSPTVSLSEGDKADIAVGITEYQINRLFHGAWSDGLLCFEAGPLAEIVEGLDASVAGPIDNPEAELSFSSAPVFSIDEGGITLQIKGLHYALRGQVDGQELTILNLDADLTLGVEVQVQHSVSSFVLSLTDSDLELSNFQADTIVKDDEEAISAVAALLEGWVMDTLPERLNNVPLYGNLFYAAGIYLRVSVLDTQAGALLIKGDLFDEDDPEVDIEEPDTEAKVSVLGPAEMLVEVGATDNSQGPFAYSLRIDKGDWTDWTDQTLVTLPTPEPGRHTLAVRARDAWLNVDSTPAEIVFRVDADTPPDNGCDCAVSGRPGAGLWAGLVVVVMGLLRRRE